MADVTVFNNGPLRLEGEIRIKDSAGKTYDLAGRDVVSLCRCGHAANKPFCAGSHARQGFSHEAQAFDLPPKK